MGLYQDNFSMLSELERLAAMVLDPVRIHEVGTDQWPLAMLACGLVTGNDPDRLQDNLRVYSVFMQKVQPATRKSALTQLSRFITQRKGEGWRAFIPYAVAETDALISSTAALQLVTLAQPSTTEKFTGLSTLVKLYRELPGANPAALSAVLGLSDMRLLPLLQLLYELPEEQFADLLAATCAPGNHLSYSWVLGALEAHPAMAETATLVLERMAAAADTVMDLVLPIPTWQFAKPTPQPLHGWTRPEYLARMLPVLNKHLSAEQLARLQAAFAA